MLVKINTEKLFSLSFDSFTCTLLLMWNLKSSPSYMSFSETVSYSVNSQFDLSILMIEFYNTVKPVLKSIIRKGLR